MDRPSGGKTRAELESKHGTNWEVAMTRCYQFFLDREAISEEYVPFFTRNQEARRDIFDTGVHSEQYLEVSPRASNKQTWRDSAVRHFKQVHA